MAPIVLILSAILTASVVAFGTHSNWGQWEYGLSVICMTRRLQWPLVIVSVFFCVMLIVMVTGGKRRAWWLIGLAPVVALFVHRFSAQTEIAGGVRENPDFVSVHDAYFMHDEDYVVGLVFNGNALAYPYAQLYREPIVIRSDREKRMMLVWSPFANSATAVEVTRDVRGRELEIVSMPANGVLVYNRLIGEFFSGITLRDPRNGNAPTGIGERIETVKVPWGQWREWHPQTRVMAPLLLSRQKAPTTVLTPIYPLPKNVPAYDDGKVLVIFAQGQPIALPMGDLAEEPLNFTVDGRPLLLLSDPATGQARAFDRRIEDDLMPYFELNSQKQRKGAYLVDRDTNTGWTASGMAVEGTKEMLGMRLTEIPVDQELDYRVMKYWYPNLMLITD